jgi:hypothetical protein
MSLGAHRRPPAALLIAAILICGAEACARPSPAPPAVPPSPAPPPTASPAPTPDGRVKPGDWLGAMVLTIAPPGDFAAFRQRNDLFNHCDPAVTRPGVYTRTCEVPATLNLFIGYGASAATAEALDAQWAKTTWELILDDRPVNLAPFGAIDLDAGGNGAGKQRLWNVVATHPPPGRHALRYVWTADGATTAVTWIFTVLPPPTPDE